MGLKAELEAIKALKKLAEHYDNDVKISAARGLARYVNHPEAVAVLNKLAEHYDNDVKKAAAKALGGIS